MGEEAVSGAFFGGVFCGFLIGVLFGQHISYKRIVELREVIEGYRKILTEWKKQ